MVRQKRKHGGNSQSSSNPDRKIPTNKGASSMRTRATINRLNMYKGGGKVRNKKGAIVSGGDLQDKNMTGNKAKLNAARVAPNRKWFGNTRVIGQQELDKFREEMTEKVADPYSVVLKRRKLPMGLLRDDPADKTRRMHLLSTESYDSVFGPKRTRKRAKLQGASDLAALVSRAESANASYVRSRRSPAGGAAMGDGGDGAAEQREEVFRKGQSKRIWAELYKVLDCSDVVVQVLDARNPLGTRSRHVENHLRKNCSHKHVVLVLNKVDLVPTWVTRKWVQLLSKEYPTLAMHAHPSKPFGKGSLIQLLRQFARLHPERKSISVGFIGYPNSGKSSIINTLRGKNVCKVAPIPGETKIWQYITLFKRVNLIDCPGVVYPSGDSEAEIVMKGVVRAERLENPQDYIPAILERIKPECLEAHYGVEGWRDADDFLAMIAIKSGRMLKGANPDTRSVAQRVIYDLQRGKLPYFVPPEVPASAEDGDASSSASGDATSATIDGIDAVAQDFSQLPEQSNREAVAQSSQDEVEGWEGRERDVEDEREDSGVADGGASSSSSAQQCSAAATEPRVESAVNWDDLDFE